MTLFSRRSLWPIRQTTSGAVNNIWDGKFHVQCTGDNANNNNGGNDWTAPASWPTCYKKQGRYRYSMCSF